MYEMRVVFDFRQRYQHFKATLFFESMLRYVFSLDYE